ncbi:hypothetical protein [Helicobacter burdigaliensis]|uniref:hypothetical protein n=1 Tax=Helicobacter burdigaliensis TaxID=2315334 RepID=UPI001E3A0F2D|nr:hypothetical protein [Helicobacter burdigaliensis]
MIDFIKKNHLLSLSMVESSAEVYCISAYYAFCEENLSLVFKSDSSTKHIALLEQNQNAGVIIAKDSKNLLDIEGLQIKALFQEASKIEKKAYYSKFPFARAVSGNVYALQILWAKYTNNKFVSKNKMIFIKDR